MNHLKSLIAALAFLLSSHAFSANWNMTNLHMQFYADHLWLFYQCGDNVYFNHEKRDQRMENENSLTFSWLTHSTMLGMRYCDGFGHSFISAGISKNSPVQTLPLADKMFMFHQTSAQSNLIKYKVYTGAPKASPDRNKWSRSTTLTDNRGIPIRTENYSAFESGGELYIAFSSRGNLFIRTPSGEIKKSRLKILSWILRE